MKNYRLTIQYDGTRYHGWQSQGNTGQTIQSKLQAVLETLEGAAVELHGSGRTDAGVHARGQVANVLLQSEPTCDEIRAHFARYLPRDIAVTDVQEAPIRFHARLNACAKTYSYRLWNNAVPNVFERPYLCVFTQALDLTAMRKAARHMEGPHDFRSFCGLSRFKKSTVRTIYAIEIKQIGSEIRFSYTGNGFLNHMVRIMTGTLVEVGLGERSPEEIVDILDAHDRAAAGRTMPPEGLCLEQVLYDPI